MVTKYRRLREALPAEIVEELKVYPELTRKLLFSRGISTLPEAERFFAPNYEEDVHDPFLLKGMEKAVKRILKAIEQKEKILVYSDYDADGIPGGIILKEFFECIGYSNFQNYIPHRHDEGYGLNNEAVETFAKEGVNLIITVDCGVADYGQITLAQSLGVDVIVTDHHELNGKIPPAYVILNPKQKNCPYPFKELCGAAVVFKLVQALIKTGDFSWKNGREKWFLDLVGMATLSDMVSLTGENRAFAHYGLKVLRKSPRPGLQKLWRKLGVDQRFLTEDEVVFSLSPRINAASRMGHPVDAFRLLSTGDHVEADQVSDYLNKVNDERKGVVASIVKDIKKNLNMRAQLSSVLVLGNPQWKPALLGLAATSVVEDFGRPVFLWGRNGENDLKGSCRSDGSVNLVSLMESVKDSFLQFGGHKLAGGFSVSHEKVHSLEEELSQAYGSVAGEREEENLWIDEKIRLDDVDESLFKQIDKFSPFGASNPKPIFLFEDVRPKGVKQFGKTKNHLEISFENSKGTLVKAISFFAKPDSFSNKPEEGKSVNLVATLEKSFFRNFPELRLRVVDII
jgi:single-stranded-DNA-specific exonuclease